MQNDNEDHAENNANFEDLLRRNVNNAGFSSNSSSVNSNRKSTNAENATDHNIDMVTENENRAAQDHAVINTADLSNQSNNERNSANPNCQARCISVIGAILRIMGDEQYCRTCGRHLRVMGDEIYFMYAARNYIAPLIQELQTSNSFEL